MDEPYNFKLRCLLSRQNGDLRLSIFTLLSADLILASGSINTVLLPPGPESQFINSDFKLERRNEQIITLLN